MKMPKETAKLDFYHPEIIPNEDGAIFIFRFEKMNSPEIADLSSEITACDGFMFASGVYYKLKDLKSTNDLEKDIYRLVVVGTKI